MSKFAKQVATAIVRSSYSAGRTFGVEDETIEARAENLLRSGKHGPYVVDGDPNEWGGDGAVATIFMEQKGDAGDCHVPLDYYEGGFDVAFKASDLLPGFYIEFINAAVAVVYPV